MPAYTARYIGWSPKGADFPTTLYKEGSPAAEDIQQEWNNGGHRPGHVLREIVVPEVYFATEPPHPNDTVRIRTDVEHLSGSVKPEWAGRLGIVRRCGSSGMDDKIFIEFERDAQGDRDERWVKITDVDVVFRAQGVST